MMGVCVEDMFLSFTLSSYDVRKSSTFIDLFNRYDY